MLKKNMLFIFCLLPLLGWAQNPNDAIDQKIQVLKERLKEEHLKEMDEDVQGQGLMIADWEKYRKDVEQIRKTNDKAQQLQKEIEQLELQKSQLNQPKK